MPLEDIEPSEASNSKVSGQIKFKIPPNKKLALFTVFSVPHCPMGDNHSRGQFCIHSNLGQTEADTGISLK